MKNISLKLKQTSLKMARKEYLQSIFNFYGCRIIIILDGYIQFELLPYLILKFWYVKDRDIFFIV